MLNSNVIFGLFLIFAVLCSSCQRDSNNKQARKQHEINIKDSTSTKQDSAILTNHSNASKKISKNLELFAQELQGENLLKINFYPENEKTSKYINHFTQLGLVNCYGYGNKKVDRYAGISYPQMNLFIAEYENVDSAKNAFDLLKVKAKNTISHSVGDRNSENESYFSYEPKHGGFIFQEDVFVISLVKTCGGNPLNLRWPEYENTFLQTLNPSKDTLEIIYSSCGAGSYEIKQKIKINNNWKFLD